MDISPSGFIIIYSSPMNIRICLTILFSLLTMFAADKDFNGRWNIEVPKEPRNRVWWLEVTGAGTPSIKGRFVGSPGGDMNDIPQIKVHRIAEFLSIAIHAVRFGFHQAIELSRRTVESAQPGDFHRRGT